MDQIDATAESPGIVLHVGDAWVPYAFAPGAAAPPHAYAETFRRLAAGDFPDSPEGRRAARDRYLEVYGIPPTVSALRERFRAVQASTCYRWLPLPMLESWPGAAVEEMEAEPDAARDLTRLAAQAEALRRRQGVPSTDDVREAELTPGEREVLRRFREGRAFRRAVALIQQRLACDGHLREPHTPGVFDAPTRAALAEFERRHRIYAQASLHVDTLAALRVPPLELERRALVRVLTERAMVDLGILEDGSAPGSPNLEAALRARVEQALGLSTVEGAARWYALVGELDGQRLLALDGIELPAYYGPDMPLEVEIDRGDVWYDFPFDRQGEPVPQPVDRKPTLTVYTRVDGRRVPLVVYRTTIGGWRIQRRGGRDVWEYKDSPTGRRFWPELTTAPVWLPPAGVRPESLVTETHRTHAGELVRELNENLLGPGYASAYGLLAARHRLLGKRPRGGRWPRGSDQGIRTHGSVDYASIWRRATHGCHRLHNHLALRLFSFILAHRQHEPEGHRPLHFESRVQLGDFRAVLRVQRSGYNFALAQPIPVNVLPGRIRGRLRGPSRKLHRVRERDRIPTVFAPTPYLP